MAALPPVESATVGAIYAAYQAEREEFDSIGLPASLIGSECDRELWYALRWASALRARDGRDIRRFRTGDLEEQRLLEDLERAGIRVDSIDPATGRQFKIFAIGGHVRGKLDGKALAVPEAPKTQHVVECKSHNEKSFKELVKKGVQLAKPKHYAQCQLYMHAESLTRSLYLAVNKNTDEIYAERVRHDPQFCMQLLVRLESIITSPRAPARISDDANKWPCVLCDHRAVCHGEAFGRNHCRTCLHATPIVDHQATDAPWLCERFGKTLSLEEQKAGCPAHLFLIEVVPGVQVDAGDDFVSYHMRDGSIWRDGVPAEAAE